ncbi:hypothetical protein KBY96_15690 [Cyanobium sp. ATX 6A2]|uniref:hypothetical protein n=1 Tax=Cyanobium sp. ATX 6A2 TaxID=2823700 RepID=UPI0020CCC3E9|nr:hypothetical protein [Cyanobium sp. ATX 6A2]MCP9889358.1 hypothetical protein [Cyanobium sp. ATX 6A2]
MAMQPCQQRVLGAVAPESVLFGAAAEAGAVDGIGGAELVVDPLGCLVSQEGGEVLPALDRFAMITGHGAAFGFFDQEREVGLDAAR